MLKGRWFVEPTVAFVVRYNGCRRAQRVGRKAAEFQLLQACAVRNLTDVMTSGNANVSRRRGGRRRGAHLPAEVRAAFDALVTPSAD